MDIVDTHTHVATVLDPRFPPMSSDLTHEWWRSGGSVEDLLTELDANGVRRAVIVQAIAAYGFDCSYATACVASHADRVAFVAAIDMHAPDPVADLAHLLDATPNARVAGIRLFGVGGGAPTWLTDGRARDVWEFAVGRDLVIVPTIFAREFANLRAVIETNPQVTVAIDHCGFIDMVEGDGEAMLFSLADIPSVHLKVTSYVLEAAERDEVDPAALAERLVAAFGSHRLCWGSDHPQDQRHDYAGKLALAHRATRNFDEESRNDFFNDTGAGLFFPE